MWKDTTGHERKTFFGDNNQFRDMFVCSRTTGGWLQNEQWKCFLRPVRLEETGKMGMAHWEGETKHPKLWKDFSKRLLWSHTLSCTWQTVQGREVWGCFSAELLKLPEVTVACLPSHSTSPGVTAQSIKCHFLRPTASPDLRLSLDHPLQSRRDVWHYFHDVKTLSDFSSVVVVFLFFFQLYSTEKKWR